MLKRYVLTGTHQFCKHNFQYFDYPQQEPHINRYNKYWPNCTLLHLQSNIEYVWCAFLPKPKPKEFSPANTHREYSILTIPILNSLLTKFSIVYTLLKLYFHLNLVHIFIHVTRTLRRWTIIPGIADSESIRWLSVTFRRALLCRLNVLPGARTNVLCLSLA